MVRDVEVPKLDWLERYKRLLDVGWGALVADEEYVYRHFGQEELTRYWRETRPMWSGPVGKKLSEKLGLKPDMEGAIKLLGVYSQELWGFGDPRYIQAKLESPTKGVFTNLACRGWEKMQAHHKSFRNAGFQIRWEDQPHRIRVILGRYVECLAGIISCDRCLLPARPFQFFEIARL